MQIKMLVGFERFRNPIERGQVLKVGRDIALFAAEDFLRDGIAVEVDDPEPEVLPAGEPAAGDSPAETTFEAPDVAPVVTAAKRKK